MLRASKLIREGKDEDIIILHAEVISRVCSATTRHRNMDLRVRVDSIVKDCPLDRCRRGDSTGGVTC